MLFKRTEILPQYERTRFSSEPFQYTSYLGFGRFFKRTLPYADYLVPQKSEFERNFFVALYICFDFIAPKRLVGFRQVAFVANPASVPKASVHEYGNPVFRKDEIRMPHQLGAAAPSGDSVFPKQRNKPKSRTFVSLRTDLGHHFRAFLLRHGIHFLQYHMRTNKSPQAIAGSTVTGKSA